ncbi:MAG: glutaminyl-peptide cyclotransferase, partial [Bryobacteraceae bacterium]
MLIERHPLPALITGFLVLLFASFALSAHADRHGTDVPVFGFEVVNIYPHNHSAFTQGLEFRGGFLYEGTGLHGQSRLRKVDLRTGRVLEETALPNQF